MGCARVSKKTTQPVKLIAAKSISIKGNAKLIISDPRMKDWILYSGSLAIDDVESSHHTY